MDLDTPYYLVRPKAGARAGAVVVHEGNGLSLQILRFCERLAGEGYAVAAPDLFFRTGGPEAFENYRKQKDAVRIEQMLDDLGAAATALRDLGMRRVGLIGFCMGGGFVWHAARHRDGYDAAIGFYGSDIARDLGEPRCPTLLFYGAHDPYVGEQEISTVSTHLAGTIVYGNAGHGFMRDGSAFYVPEAASDAWSRMLSHLGEHLGGRR